MSKKYREKLVVEAIEFTNNNEKEIIEFLNGNANCYDGYDDGGDKTIVLRKSNSGLQVPKGIGRVSRGSYIIKCPINGVSILHKETFKAIYEEI